jgi:SMC interacting uncharacterized protein involved in chromosome segregation
MDTGTVASAVINEATLLPLGFVISLVASFLGGVVWLTKINYDVSNLKSSMNTVDNSLKREVDQSKIDSDRLLKLEVQLQNVMDIVREVRQTLTKVEDRLSKK